MSSSIKTLVGSLLAITAFLASALALDTEFKTRFVSSAALTIHVKDGQFITIRNFTQDKDVGLPRGVIVAGINPTPTPAPVPTSTPTPTPTSTPTPTQTDLTATKTDNVGGQATFPNQWTWNIHVANGGNTPGSFALLQTILTDNLPNSNITYGSPTVTNLVNVTPNSTSAIDCTISVTNDLNCTAAGNVTIGAGGSFDVSFTATPGAVGTYANPRAGGDCSVDPGNVVAEANETNNTCADTVNSNVPNPTPTPINAVVLTAALLNPLPAEFIKPIIIAGPATLTINPVPGATLSITYRKSLQPIQPTATPTSTVTSTSATSSTSSATTTSSTGTSTRSATVIESVEDDIEWSTPSGSQTPSPTATPTATPTASSASPTPTPTIIPTPTP